MTARRAVRSWRDVVVEVKLTRPAGNKVWRHSLRTAYVLIRSPNNRKGVMADEIRDFRTTTEVLKVLGNPDALYEWDWVLAAKAPVAVPVKTPLAEPVVRTSSPVEKKGPSLGNAPNVHAELQDAHECPLVDVLLKSGGQKKIAVIKEIRGILDLNLKDAKALVDRAPVIVKANITTQEAQDIAARLDAAGAVMGFSVTYDRGLAS